MDKQIRIALVGLHSITDKLRRAAAEHMPKVLARGDIEYELITPHGSAEAVAGDLIKLNPHVILLGFPQAEVSAWDIATELQPFNACPIVLVRLPNGTRTNVPSGFDVIEEGDIAGLCAAIQRRLNPTAAATGAVKR